MSAASLYLRRLTGKTAIPPPQRVIFSYCIGGEYVRPSAPPPHHYHTRRFLTAAAVSVSALRGRYRDNGRRDRYLATDYTAVETSAPTRLYAYNCVRNRWTDTHIFRFIGFPGPADFYFFFSFPPYASRTSVLDFSSVSSFLFFVNSRSIRCFCFFFLIRYTGETRFVNKYRSSTFLHIILRCRCYVLRELQDYRPSQNWRVVARIKVSALYTAAATARCPSEGPPK